MDILHTDLFQYEFNENEKALVSVSAAKLHTDTAYHRAYITIAPDLATHCPILSERTGFP
jgi:hypothetical protein|eukprot:scaffold3624_cov106-Skeletonema_marinoi.AAC.2